MVTAGVVIHLQGSSFMPTDAAAACYTGDAASESAVASTAIVRCEVAFHPYLTDPSLAVSHGSMTLGNSTGLAIVAEAWYLPTPELMALKTSRGPSRGGTLVSILGRNFVAGTDIICRFGATEVRGQVISEKEIRCRSPAAPVGAVPLRVLLQPGSAPSAPLSFTYYL